MASRQRRMTRPKAEGPLCDLSDKMRNNDAALPAGDELGKLLFGQVFVIIARLVVVAVGLVIAAVPLAAFIPGHGGLDGRKRAAVKTVNHKDAVARAVGALV